MKWFFSDNSSTYWLNLPDENIYFSLDISYQGDLQIFAYDFTQHCWRPKGYFFFYHSRMKQFRNRISKSSTSAGVYIQRRELSGIQFPKLINSFRNTLMTNILTLFAAADADGNRLHKRWEIRTITILWRVFAEFVN